MVLRRSHGWCGASAVSYAATAASLSGISGGSVRSLSRRRATKSMNHIRRRRLRLPDTNVQSFRFATFREICMRGKCQARGRRAVESEQAGPRAPRSATPHRTTRSTQSHLVLHHPLERLAHAGVARGGSRAYGERVRDAACRARLAHVLEPARNRGCRTRSGVRNEDSCADGSTPRRLPATHLVWITPTFSAMSALAMPSAVPSVAAGSTDAWDAQEGV
jgi:hypothetical protein